MRSLSADFTSKKQGKEVISPSFMFFVSVFLAPLSNSLIISFVVLLLMCFQEPLLLSLGISLDPAPADCIAAHPSSVSAFLLGSLSQPLRPFPFQHWSSLMSSPSIRAGLTRLLSFLHSRADHPCAFRRLSLKTSIIFTYPCNLQCFYLEGKHYHGA